MATEAVFEITILRPELVDAVDQLNSWVRSRSSRSVPRRLVYSWKDKVLTFGRKHGLLTERYVKVFIKCRDCGGTGKYVIWDGLVLDHCYACGNRGIVWLYFRESTIQPTGQVWHTPYHFDDNHIDVTADDWRPNTAGRDLDHVRVAELLNICEENFGVSLHEDNRYKLFVGDRDRRCWKCDSEAIDDVRYCCSNDLVEWHAFSCAAHRGLEVHHTELPASLIQSPAIVIWLSHHFVAHIKAPLKRLAC